MFDIGWSEILVILVVLLVVVGPKDLPRIVRTFGQWSGKARSYARDFQRTIEEAAEESEMSAIRKEIELANKELAETQRAAVNLDTTIKLDDAADPQAAQFAGGAVARVAGVEPAAAADPASSAVAQAVQAGEAPPAAAAVVETAGDAHPVKPS